MSEEKILTQGIVLESSHGIFQIKLENDHVVTGYLSGKMKKYKIKVIIGDKVSIEFSPYDLERGRIMERERVARRAR